jgi:hypothetical protein
VTKEHLQPELNSLSIREDKGPGMNRQVVHIISEIVNFRPIDVAGASAGLTAFIGNTAFTVWKVPCILRDRLAHLGDGIENIAKSAENYGPGIGEKTMKKVLLLAVLACISCPVQAKEKSYEKGVLLQMESSPCGYAEKGSKTIAGEILGTDGEHKNTKEMLCPEYVLQADRVIYRIRPKDDKHPTLLPIGETAQFRIEKDKLILRVPEANDKEREYSVVSMTPRTDGADARSAKNTSSH